MPGRNILFDDDAEISNANIPVTSSVNRETRTTPTGRAVIAAAKNQKGVGDEPVKTESAAFNSLLGDNGMRKVICGSALGKKFFAMVDIKRRVVTPCAQTPHDSSP